jgi:hypothetical protein
MQVDLRSIFSPEVIIEEVVINVEKIICDKANNGDINVVKLGNMLVRSPKNPTISPESNVPGANDEVILSNKEKRKERKWSKKETAFDKTNDANEKPSQVAATGTEKHFVVKKMKIHLGDCELYNMAGKGEHKTVKLDLTWNFTNVRSGQDVVRKITEDLQIHGVAVVIGSALGAIFNLSGISYIKNSIHKVGKVGQGLMRGIAEAIGGFLPGREGTEHSAVNLKKESKTLNESSSDALPLDEKSSAEI